MKASQAGAAGYVQNPTNNPYAPPVYSPFQNASHVDDAFGYLANMYGPMLVQGMFGQDAFLAHQMPGQALLDQYTASRYQRHGAAAIQAANMAGNEQVAQKLLGFQRGVNGGKPITALDREHANVGASVLNNPIFKQFAASQIGAENLEAIMFGRRGDPTAIAAATNRIGFFRQDAAGNGPRMSAESLQQFSQNVYQNLYGPDANLDDMHGFGAVASSEMMETLFQQGRLPQSIGALSPADRVKALSKSKRDDKTLTRLAEQMGHSELMDRDYDYANATEEERKIMLKDKLPEYKKRMQATFGEIDKYTAGDKRAKSAEEIQQLDGFGLAANALDARQVSKTVKEYNGAVAAIREIFGDNGNPNAPIQELLANLQHLTNGAQTSMGAGKVESLVREIRMAARDSNTDLQNLNAIAYEKKAQARQLGLSEVTAEKGLAGDLLMGQAMADAGVFEKSGFGKLNRAEAEARMSALSTRGDASSVGRSMAALNRMTMENPDKYKDTQLAAAMEAYRRGEDTYEFKGKSFNLTEMAGRQGVQGLYNMARESGADDRLYRAYMSDQIGTEEYLNAGYAYKSQRFEMQRELSRPHEGVIRDRMTSDAIKRLKPAGMSDADFKKKNRALASGFAYKMTGVMLDETADMSVDERVATLEKRGKEELARYFQSSEGGKMNQREADRAAEQYFNAIYGDTASKRRDSLLATYSEASTASQNRTGVSIEALKQQYDKKAISDRDTKLQVNKQRAARFAQASRGTESTTLQRVGEELENLAADNTRTRSDALKAIFNVTSEDRLLQTYAPDMQEGLVAAAKMYTSATMTGGQIEKLAEAAQKNPNGAEAKQLKQLAGLKPDEKLTDENIAMVRDRAIRKSGDTAAGTTDAEKKQNEQTRKQSELIMRGFNSGKTEDVKAAATAMAQQVLGPKATKEQIEKFATAALSTDTAAFEKQMQGGTFGFGKLSAEKQQQARGIAKALRVAQDIGGLGSAGLEQSASDVAAAQDRPTAKTNEIVSDVSKAVYDQMESKHDRAEYEKLRPKGMSDVQFDRQRRERLKMISDAAATVAVEKGGALAGETAEKRAEVMGKNITQQLTKQFVLQGKSPEEAEMLARKELRAVLGTDPKKVTERLNNIMAAATKAKRDRGIGVAEVAEKASAEQQKLLDEVGADPSGAAMKEAMQDDKKRQLLLTIPNADAVSLFNKFTPEAQREGLAALESAENGLYSWGLTEDERKNVGRIRGAISENQKKTTSGAVSSQNISPERVQQLNRQGHAPASADRGQTHTLSRDEALGEVRQELAQIEGRKQDGWLWDSLSPEDQKRKDELTARLNTMQYGTGDGYSSGTIEKFKVHDPYNARGVLPGQSFSMRDIAGESEWHLFGGYQNVSERVFIPHNPNYTEEQAALDVERYGTDEEKAEFRKNGAKKINVTNPDGSTSQVVEKPHIKLLAEQAMHDAVAEDPLTAARQRLGELEKKKKRGWFSDYFDDDKDQARYNLLTDVVAQQERRGASMAGGPGAGGEMNINGTLILQGLSEAVLQASGVRMEETPENGPSVDMANGTGSRFGR